MTTITDPVYMAQTDDGTDITVGVYSIADRIGLTPDDSDPSADLEIEVVVELEGEPDPITWRMTRPQAVEIAAGLVHALAWQPAR
jgi:hypothetical protein